MTAGSAASSGTTPKVKLKLYDKVTQQRPFPLRQHQSPLKKCPVSAEEWLIIEAETAAAVARGKQLCHDSDCGADGVLW